MSTPTLHPTVRIDTKFVNDSTIRAQICESAGWHVFGLRVLERSQRLAPGKLGAGMFCHFYYGADGRIEIGNPRTVKGGLNLFGLIERGTKAHFIPMGAPDSPSGGPLAFYWKKMGTSVVFAWVKHPGTKKNPFVERATQQVVHEAAGLKLVKV